DYIPALAAADPEAFGISVVEVDGEVHERGDADIRFSIQSISQAFVYALLCDRFGNEKIREIDGVDNTGLAFNSVMAIELNHGHPRNPTVNAGAIATTALLPGDSAQEQWAMSASARCWRRRMPRRPRWMPPSPSTRMRACGRSSWDS